MTEVNRRGEQGRDSAMGAFHERLRQVPFGGPQWKAFTDQLHLTRLSNSEQDPAGYRNNNPTLSYRIALAAERRWQRMNAPDGLEYRAAQRELEEWTGPNAPFRAEVAATLLNPEQVGSTIASHLIDAMESEATQRMLDMQSMPPQE